MLIDVLSPTLQVLPVLCLYHTFASSVCRSVEHVARSKVLRVEAMTQLHLVSEAVLALKGLLNGSGLPQEHNHFARPPQSHGVRVVPCCHGYMLCTHTCTVVGNDCLSCSAGKDHLQ